ncbi:MAG: NfeD family protein [Anaerolineaceae bacterium]|jgi:membrane-bound serine protease (ClpP class)|nr:NfeD family protein [Anaerolineaceae bacterium]
MNPIIDPNIAYVLLVVGFVLSVLALLTPGTGVVEIIGLFSMILAGYGIISNPSHYWALLILIPFLPLIYVYRKTKKDYFLIISIALLNIGSFMIFKSDSGGFAVSPIVAIVVILLNAPILWVIVKKIIEAIDTKSVFDPANIVGVIGEARTNIFLDGTAYVMGEEWSARSDVRIEKGEKIKVIKKEGLVLLVENLNNLNRRIQ